MKYCMKDIKDLIWKDCQNDLISTVKIYETIYLNIYIKKHLQNYSVKFVSINGNKCLNMADELKDKGLADIKRRS